MGLKFIASVFKKIFIIHFMPGNTPPMMSSRPFKKTVTTPLLEWFDSHGRHDLPWQHPRDAYRVWISEIMLQQTQVKTVIPYFNRFITQFPTLQTLALASEDNVLSHWSGLGYYSRARYLHQTAKIIHTTYHDIFPEDISILVTLPGIGPSTAAAIASLAFQKPTAILDGNVKRVLSRYFLVDGNIQQTSTHKTLWQLANDCMSPDRCADYTQAIMDLGATCCTVKNPKCTTCPLQNTCLAYIEDKVALYPNKTPKKIRPTKQQQFLLLHTDQQKIYLEKRPPKGIWGGLWCLPSMDSVDCPKTYMAIAYGLTLEKIDPLMTLKHAFTHFLLHINALSVYIPNPNESEYSGYWVAPHELSGLGLAKPVRVILDYFLGLDRSVSSER